MSADGHGSRAFVTSVVGVEGVWPTAPDLWSYSSLSQFETCPRQWALSRASYQGIWDRDGYPTLPSPAGLAGEAVHRALEQIVRELVHAGCGNPADPSAVDVLRSLGGYSNILRNVSDRVLDQLVGNPRAVSRIEHFRRLLAQRNPEMRQQTQALVATAALTAGPSLPRAARSSGIGNLSSISDLPEGSYPELNVSSRHLGIAGRFDLVSVTYAGVEIVDFKTGAPDESHRNQLRTYEVLWAHRDRRAQDRLPVWQVVLAYPGHRERLVPLSSSELAERTAELQSRTTLASDAANGEPTALPSEACTRCQVRHLCDTYWGVARERSLGEGIGDYEVQVTAVNGPRSWTFESARENGVLRSDGNHGLAPGRSVRLLNARRTPAVNDHATVLSLTAFSEVFVVATR